jgi:hypothetical protein
MSVQEFTVMVTSHLLLLHGFEGLSPSRAVAAATFAAVPEAGAAAGASGGRGAATDGAG